MLFQDQLEAKRGMSKGTMAQLHTLIQIDESVLKLGLQILNFPNPVGDTSRIF